MSAPPHSLSHPARFQFHAEEPALSPETLSCSPLASGKSDHKCFIADHCNTSGKKALSVNSRVFMRIISPKPGTILSATPEKSLRSNIPRRKSCSACRQHQVISSSHQDLTAPQQFQPSGTIFLSSTTAPWAAINLSNSDSVVSILSPASFITDSQDGSPDSFPSADPG